MAAEFDSERRRAPRCSTYFLAVEHQGDDVYYRVVTNVSAGGFFYEEPVPMERPGDEVVMDFPLPGRREPIRIRGEVRFVQPRKGIGVRFTQVSAGTELEQLVAQPPPPLDE
jgi:hypothetical protein